MTEGHRNDDLVQQCSHAFQTAALKWQRLLLTACLTAKANSFALSS